MIFSRTNIFANFIQACAKASCEYFGAKLSVSQFLNHNKKNHILYLLGKNQTKW